jgi:hypothetical protein
MPEPMALAGFGVATKLFELLRETVGLRVASKRRFYDDHIKPIYEALENINHDYMSTITGFDQKLRDKGDDGLSEALAMIRLRQGEMRSLKDTFKGLAEAYRSPKRRKFPGKSSPFFEACLHYFEVSQTEMTPGVAGSGKRFDSWYAQMLGDEFAEQMEELANGPASQGYIYSADRLKNELVNRWREVTLAYGEVKRDLLN